MAKRAVTMEPKRIRSHSVLGFIYHRVGRPVDAAASLRKALELDPNSGPDHTRLLNALYVAGAPLEELRAEYPSVKQYLEALVAEFPDSLALRMEFLNAAVQAQIADDAVAISEAVLARGD